MNIKKIIINIQFYQVFQNKIQKKDLIIINLMKVFIILNLKKISKMNLILKVENIQVKVNLELLNNVKAKLIIMIMLLKELNKIKDNQNFKKL